MNHEPEFENTLPAPSPAATEPLGSALHRVPSALHPVPMPQIDHIGIAVRSIAQARRLYETLGFQIVHEETVEQEQVRTAMIPAGDVRIELLEPTSDDSPVGRFLAKRGEGLHHIALHVDDISAALETLRAQGARLLSDDIQIGAGGHFYFFVHPSSAAGVLLEICQDSVSDV